MSEPYLSEIRAFSFNFAPSGWLMCNGQTLAIAQYQALFALIGTTYGGNGIQTFQLPNLQGRVPLHAGTAPSGTSYVPGQMSGETSHTLIISEMPSHNHTAAADATVASVNSPSGAYPAALSNAYTGSAPVTPVTMANSNTAGSGTAHSNQSPFLVVNFCIAMTGLFPTRN